MLNIGKLKNLTISKKQNLVKSKKSKLTKTKNLDFVQAHFFKTDFFIIKGKETFIHL